MQKYFLRRPPTFPPDITFSFSSPDLFICRPTEFELKYPDNGVFIKNLSVHLIQENIKIMKEINPENPDLLDVEIGKKTKKKIIPLSCIQENMIHSPNSRSISVRGHFAIPRSCAPTYKGTRSVKLELFASDIILEIQYTLQVKIKTNEGKIDGKFPVNIRHYENRDRAGNSSTATAMITTGKSQVQIPSAPSAGSCPRYSMLSLHIAGATRRSSVETLPPTYDEAVCFPK